LAKAGHKRACFAREAGLFRAHDDEAGAHQATRRLIDGRLAELYPETPVPLDHTDAFSLLVAVLLSAQCTDKRVNLVTPHLWKLADTPAKMARAGGGNSMRDPAVRALAAEGEGDRGVVADSGRET
jgi:hypothetical protein